jgi:hypothetical protein
MPPELIDFCTQGVCVYTALATGVESGSDSGVLRGLAL